MQAHPECCNRIRRLAVICVGAGGVTEHEVAHSLLSQTCSTNVVELYSQQILSIIPVPDRCVLSWEEERAEECDIADFRDHVHREEGEKFRQECASLLSQEGFSDLTPSNVGRFRT